MTETRTADVPIQAPIEVRSEASREIPSEVSGDVSVVQLDSERWDRAVGKFPARTVFHLSPWLEAVARRYGLQVQRFVAGDPDDPIAVWPWLSQRKGPLTVAGSPLPGWGTAYMGPLVRGPQGADGVAAILKRPELHKASYLEARVIVDEQQLDLEPCGFTPQAPFSTYLLDLRKEEEALWAGMTNKCRNIVRKGRKSGYEIRREEGTDWIEAFYAMALEVFSNWGLKPPYDQAFLQHIHENLDPAGHLWVYSSWRDGKRDATSVFFRDDRRLYYWAAGSYDQAKKLAPNNVLVWEVMCHAREQGLELLDFISSSGTAGRYKKNFGPEERMVCQHYSRSRTALEGALKRGYEAFVRWRRRK